MTAMESCTYSFQLRLSLFLHLLWKGASYSAHILTACLTALLVDAPLIRSYLSTIPRFNLPIPYLDSALVCHMKHKSTVINYSTRKLVLW